VPTVGKEPLLRLARCQRRKTQRLVVARARDVRSPSADEVHRPMKSARASDLGARVEVVRMAIALPSPLARSILPTFLPTFGVTAGTLR
jgi:hypothetical protein